MVNSTLSELAIPQHWFPYTKLQPPQLGHHLVVRSRLSAQLFEAINQHKLTLVAAPAGSGKTSLLATLPPSKPATAWIALDATDDDLPVFVALLVTALQQQLQDDGEAILGFLQTVPFADEVVAQLASLLINQIRPFEQEPFILILDDYHTIESQSIHQFVTYFLDYMPPALRVVIGTRHDPPLPLPRLRMRKQLAELRLPTLRFDEAETAVFLNQTHQLELTTAEVTHLAQHTEGWIAGLQLLASVLTTIPQGQARSHYINNLDTANRSIFDLLVAEVFALQPPDIQEFLLQTSILPEITVENCAAVTQNTAVMPLLTAVYQRNLFLRSLASDSRLGPFRYHDLFADFLQQRLREEHPAQWPELHRRAAEAAATTEQKLSHLMQANLWKGAADLLEEMGHFDTQRRFTRRFVIRQIEALPQPVVQKRPWLSLFVAQYYSVRGLLEQALPWREQADVGFREQGDELGQIEVLIARAMTDDFDSEAIVNAFRQKIAVSGHLFRPDQWIVYHGIEFWHAIVLNDWQTISEHTQACLTRAIESNDPGTLNMAALVMTAPQVLFNDKGMALPEKFARRCLEIADGEDWLLQLCGHALLGFIHYYQGRVDEAEQAIREAHRFLLELGGHLAWIDDHISWLMLTLPITRRSYRTFADFFAAQTDRWQSQMTSASYLPGIYYLQGHAYWLQNRLEEAEAVLKQIENYDWPTGYETSHEVGQLLLAGLIAMNRGDSHTAEKQLRQALKMHERVRHTFFLTHPRLALATFYGRFNRWSEALHEFRIVIQEIKSRGMPGIILQEGESIVPVLEQAIKEGIEVEMLRPLLHILQPDDTPQAIPIPNSHQHLTPREAEVLQCLATGATNPEIASQLVITERTVKAHVTRILAKLEATTRTEAVSKASQLGLL